MLRSAAVEANEIAELTGIGRRLVRGALLAGRVVRLLRGPNRAARVRAALRVRLSRVLPVRRSYAAK